MASRSGFSSRIGFIAAAAGSAVGLGNIWRFPYETAQNGGGAFLLLYLICTFLIGFPIMVGEISLGRNTQTDPFGAYKKAGNKNWGFVGFFGVLCGIMILSFYNVIAGWSLGYFIQIAFGDLLSQADFGAYFGNFVSNEIGSIIVYAILFMLLTAVIVVRGVQDGIETVAKILMPMLFLILVGLIVYALTLPNSGKGLEYYFTPDFSKINIGTINSAMGQAFFSLSLGMGALITYGSYISKKENIISSAAIVTTADMSVAFLAGLLMIPLITFQNPDPDFTSAGPGLVFIVLPEVFASMGPVLGKVIGATFFLLLSVAALTSTISLLEVPSSYLIDEHKVKRPVAVFSLAILIFLLGIPSLLSQGAVPFLTEFVSYGGGPKDFLTVINDIFSEIGLPLGGLLLSIFISTTWKNSKMSEEISSGNSKYIGSGMETFINVTIRYISPILLGLVFITNLLEKLFDVSLF